MEVTIDNFREIADEIKSSIQNCKFLSIDLEFSGIKSSLNCCNTDTPYEQFVKRKEIVSKYQIIQFGITLFFRNKNFRYDSKSYCFYVKPDIDIFSDIVVNYETLDFLNENCQINFNKWLKKGILYYNQKAREEIVKIFLTDFEKFQINKKKLSQLDQKDRDYLNQKFFNFKNWLINPYNQNIEYKLIEHESLLKAHFIEFIKESETLKNCEFYVVCYEKFDSKRNDHYLHFKKHLKMNQDKNFIFQQSQEQQQIISKQIGFNYLWDIVKQEIKQRSLFVIGHNLLVDIFYIMQQFEKPITDDYQQFKKEVHSIFPFIVDTKLLSQIFKLSYCNLEQLYENCQTGKMFQKQIFVSSKNYSQDEKKYHNAGYDSYISGCCYLSMVKNLPQNNTINSFINQLKILGKSYYSLSLNNEQDFVVQDNVFVIYVQKLPDRQKKINREIHLTLRNTFDKFIKDLLYKSEIVIEYSFQTHQMIDGNFCIFFDCKNQDNYNIFQQILKKFYKVDTLSSHNLFTQKLDYIFNKNQR